MFLWFKFDQCYTNVDQICELKRICIIVVPKLSWYLFLSFQWWVNRSRRPGYIWFWELSTKQLWAGTQIVINYFALTNAQARYLKILDCTYLRTIIISLNEYSWAILVCDWSKPRWLPSDILHLLLCIMCQTIVILWNNNNKEIF